MTLRALLVAALLFVPLRGHAAERLPNILVVLFDDMGWGQPPSYRSDSALRTPRLDQLAAEGMRFTDAHAAAAVCTPTRYGLLTGR
ncbi:MAG: sulfatase-like hydrolase/transferase, partial [Pirellulaceae bacterium]